MIVPFIKMSAAGNDFILIDNRNGLLQLPWPDFARRYCQRRLSIGADGLLVINRSNSSDFSMLYFNADGSSGGMCGNGGRCAAEYIMSSNRVESVSFDALDYIYHASRENDKIRLRMKNPTAIQLNIRLHIYTQSLDVHYVNSGSPHVVIYLDSLPGNIVREITEHGIGEIGRTIRSDMHFQPDGTNVDFVTISNDGTLSMRTYERGVEEETLACGTGAVACSIISALVKNMPSPVNVRTKSDQILTVYYSKHGNNFTEVILEGNVTYAFRGEIEYTQKGRG